MRILFDMDGVLADLHEKWLRVYNEEWFDDLTVAQLSDYRMHLHVKGECGKAIYDVIQRPGFFDDVRPIESAVEAFRQLTARGHDVRVCSTPIGSDSARAKYDWCARHLAASNYRVTLTSEKEYVWADVLIEDSPSVIQKWKNRHPSGTAIALGYPYNAPQAGEGQPERDTPAYPFVAGALQTWDYRADGWDRPERAWAQIMEWLS